MRVVPILCDSIIRGIFQGIIVSFSSIFQKFASINGVLFPGGGASLKDTPFYRVAEKLFNVILRLAPIVNLLATWELLKFYVFLLILLDRVGIFGN